MPLKTAEVLQILEETSKIKKSKTKFHLLGITRLDSIFEFARYGVVSFDSTAPLLQAFKSEKDNYHTKGENFIALRIPQVDGNPKLKARILAGEIDQASAIRLERGSLATLRDYAGGKVSLKRALSSLMAYAVLYDEALDGKQEKIDAREVQYRHTLEARPWEVCPCSICKSIGHEVIIFRGAERNRRRGFHNLDTFYRRLLATGVGSDKFKSICA